MLLKFYYFELKHRCFYLAVSFVLCLLVAFTNIHILLLFTTYPFLYSFYQKFIFTNITELIELFWFLIPNISFLFALPFFIYQIKNFLKSSFYPYQVCILNFNVKLIYVNWVFSILLC